MALDLVRNNDGDCVGVVALEMETGNLMFFESKATVLATGGAGRIWAASTNAFINTGDGAGMAAGQTYRCRIWNFGSFIQLELPALVFDYRGRERRRRSTLK